MRSSTHMRNTRGSCGAGSFCHSVDGTLRRWPRTRAACHEVWFVAVDDEVRVGRLIGRHTQFGKSEEDAREWVLRNDEANARLVIASAERADLVVTMH